jgi:hypothetical protein
MTIKPTIDRAPLQTMPAPVIPSIATDATEHTSPAVPLPVEFTIARATGPRSQNGKAIVAAQTRVAAAEREALQNRLNSVATLLARIDVSAEPPELQNKLPEPRHSTGLRRRVDSL